MLSTQTIEVRCYTPIVRHPLLWGTSGASKAENTRAASLPIRNLSLEYKIWLFFRNLREGEREKRERKVREKIILKYSHQNLLKGTPLSPYRPDDQVTVNILPLSPNPLLNCCKLIWLSVGARVRDRTECTRDSFLFCGVSVC